MFKQDGANGLSLELILKIFNYMPVKDIVTASLVCKTFLSYSNSDILWKYKLQDHVPKFYELISKQGIVADKSQYINFRKYPTLYNAILEKEIPIDCITMLNMDKNKKQALEKLLFHIQCITPKNISNYYAFFSTCNKEELMWQRDRDAANALKAIVYNQKDPTCLDDFQDLLCITNLYASNSPILVSLYVELVNAGLIGATSIKHSLQ